MKAASIIEKVLIIDRNKKNAAKLSDSLKEESYAPIIAGKLDCCVTCEIRPVVCYAPVIVDNVDAGLKYIKGSEDLKVVLLNVELSQMRGLEALTKIKREHPEIIVIVVGAAAATVRKAVRLGALDVAPKTLNMEDIHWMLDRAFCRLYARDKIFSLLTGEVSKDLSCLVGESKLMIELNKAIGLVARDTSSVLIEGETGTGKGLVARLIHEESERAAESFIAIDCGAVPDELRASELFGYEKGAFTGAKSEGKPGRFELADGGTLFLDEVGNMTPALQSTLLNVLQTQEIERLGGTRTHKVDIRVIAATHQDLGQMVVDGKFRYDLFHRLKGYQICLPSLRERKEDISLLVRHFLQHVQGKGDRPMPGISEKAMKLLHAYDWPGNVRELENCLKSATVSSQGEVILPKDLPQEIRIRRSERNAQNRQSLKPARTPMVENVSDLPIVEFCKFISGEENITETQKQKNGPIAFADLLAEVEKVVENALTRLSVLRYGTDFKRAAAQPISIKGRTLAGSLIAVLHEILKEYGDDREKTARMLQIDAKTLDGWIDPQREVKRETSKRPSRVLEPIPAKEIESLLTEPVDYFVTEQFSRAEWRAKSPNEQIRTVHLALKSVSARLAGDQGCIYFGGMTFEQIQKRIYRRSGYLYSDETEAAEALDVDVRTFRRHWSWSGSEAVFPNRYTLF